MTVCCLICTLVGFVLVFVHVEGWSEVRSCITSHCMIVLQLTPESNSSPGISRNEIRVPVT